MSSRLEKIAMTRAADMAPCGDHVVLSAPTIAHTTNPMGIAPTARRAGPAPRRCGGWAGCQPETIVAHAANAALALAEVS